MRTVMDGKRSDTAAELCGCLTCGNERREANKAKLLFPGPMNAGWRYSCEVCGNKRCPHHTDHRLACTGSNETGQPGSAWA
jgi:hypothetical protein